MLQKLKIAKEKSKLKLNLLKHANSNLETRTCVSGIGTVTFKVCVILNTPFVYNVVIP